MYAEYDDALRIFAGTGPEFGGRPSHGTTVAAALTEMGRRDVVLPWVQKYRHGLESRLPILSPIERHTWQLALGTIGRSSDWVAFFQRELVHTEWYQVLKRWVPRLAPGLSGVAGNGLVRTAMCLSSLEADASKVRKIELAEGLAYWATRYHNLPGIPAGRSAGTLLPARAINRVHRVDKSAKVSFSAITDGLKLLNDLPQFTGVVNLVAIPDNPDDLLGNITELFAKLILGHTDDPARQLGLIPGFSTASALRILLPYVSTEDSPFVLRYLWQFVGALIALFANSQPADTIEQVYDDVDQLANESIATGNEHIIQFTAACRREYLLHPKPAFPATIRAAHKLLMRDSDIKDDDDAQPLYRDF